MKTILVLRSRRSVEMIVAGTRKIPRDRIAVLIGKDGSTKTTIENTGNVLLEVNSKNGEVTVLQREDAMKAVIAVSVIQAIGRGFSPEKALYLFNEDFQIYMISLREFARTGSNRISEIKGRLIGRQGRTREIIEELTSCMVSVYGDTVSIIGDYISLEYGKEAILKLITGSKQRTVYQYLERSVEQIKLRKMEETFR